MKYHNIEDLPKGNSKNSVRKTILLILFFTTLTTFPLYLRRAPTLPPVKAPTCDISNGTWVPSLDDEPYYTNHTCKLIIDEQNCMKFGRPDSDFLRWRWMPDGCELRRFDAGKFLSIVGNNKSMAFVGDSVGKNQMYSLLCLLAGEAGEPDDVSAAEEYGHGNETTYFKRFAFRGRYNFTVATLWAPFLVRAEESDPNGYSRNSRMNLFIDEPSRGWWPEVAGFDYVVVSAGQWFFRPAMIYRNKTLIGCSNCPSDSGSDSLPRLTTFEVYREAFRTAFRGLVELRGGLTFLRTFSPSHFEGGAWNDGGKCERREPFRREVSPEWYVSEMRRVQVEEFDEVRDTNGSGFRVMDVTRAMFLRPDGHPNFFGRSSHRNMSYADCVHWCVPGPIDLWNEILLHSLTDTSSLP